MKSWKFRLGIVAIFALGVVVGAVATGLFVRHRFSNFGFVRPDQAVSHIMGRLERELKLSEEQRHAIEPIVADGFTKMRALRARLTPEVEALVAETSQRIKQHLDAEQQRHLEEHYTEVMKRWRIYAGPGAIAPGTASPGAAAPARPQGK
jgi:excinuclease UvrABC ATPase subunit